MELKKIYSENNNSLIAFAESRIGGRSENQDSYGWQETPHGYLVTVCDGMGGGPGGKTASSIAVNEIIDGINEANNEEDIPNIIIKAIRRANMAILEAANETPSLKGMGSTATVLLINDNSAFIAHVGDSRIYQFRGHKKVYRTFDHSLVFEMVAQGVITEEQARLSASSNIIQRALGIKFDIEVDITEVPYEKGDRFMLCTDGISGALPEQDIISMATSRKVKLPIVVDDLATTIDDIGRKAGCGHDNLTLAIIETKTNSKLKVKMSKKTKILAAIIIAMLLISLSLNILQLLQNKNCNTESTTKVQTEKVINQKTQQ